MKTLCHLAFIAIASCLAFVSCSKNNDDGGTITVNGVTYTNVKATCEVRGGVFFNFDLGDGITATGLVDYGLAFDKTLHFGYDEDNGGYGDWLPLEVDYPNGTHYTAMPKSGTQTMKENGGTISVVIDGKDENNKDYKVNVVAKVTVH